jgi:cyclopropane fatty-acyl-phospholipid synthase-like methyltransferase
MSDGSGQHSFFRRAYDRRPPWDIGRPQKELVRAEAEGLVRGDVLDVGCGTGDNALFLAERGHAVLGVDLAETAIAEARGKAAERGLEQRARFEVRDVVDAPDVGRTFSTVTDCGFFHALDDEARVRFVESLGSLLETSGRYLMLCFSDRVPGSFGPRRISEAEIRATFAGAGWRVAEVRPARLESSVKLVPWVPAWFAVVERV